MTAVQFLSKEVFLGCECSYNLFTLKRDPQAATDEARAALECVGRFHVGEMINCIQKGSLVMQLPDSEVSKIPTMPQVGLVATAPVGFLRGPIILCNASFVTAHCHAAPLRESRVAKICRSGKQSQKRH